jgi:hypothetical protein
VLPPSLDLEGQDSSPATPVEELFPSVASAVILFTDIHTIIHLPKALLAVSFLLIPVLGFTAETQSVAVTVPTADTLGIEFPSMWQSSISQPPQLPPTVRISTKELSLQITFIPDPQGRFATRDGVDRVVTAANERYVSGSIEKRLTLIPLESKNGYGCYSTFTDAELAGVATLRKGQFRNVASGMLVINKQAAVFTLLTNNTKSPDYRQALRIISEGICRK